MAKFDLEGRIRALVADEVKHQLEPYRDLLNGVATFAGGEEPKRGPGRPPRKVEAGAARPAKKAAARRPAAKGPAVDVGRFHEGQLVRYKQGRGEFEAKVLAIDPENNSLTLERTTDKKQVERPADKIYEAA